MKRERKELSPIFTVKLREKWMPDKCLQSHFSCARRPLQRKSGFEGRKEKLDDHDRRTANLAL